jgi:hypothetical protein
VKKQREEEGERRRLQQEAERAKREEGFASLFCSSGLLLLSTHSSAERVRRERIDAERKLVSDVQ